MSPGAQSALVRSAAGDTRMVCGSAASYPATLRFNWSELRFNRSVVRQRRSVFRIVSSALRFT